MFSADCNPCFSRRRATLRGARQSRVFWSPVGSAAPHRFFVLSAGHGVAKAPSPLRSAGAVQKLAMPGPPTRQTGVLPRLLQHRAILPTKAIRFVRLKMTSNVLSFDVFRHPQRAAESGQFCNRRALKGRLESRLSFDHGLGQPCIFSRPFACFADLPDLGHIQVRGYYILYSAV